MAQKQHQFVVPVALLLAAILIGGAVYYATTQPSEAHAPAWGGTAGPVPAPVAFAGPDQPTSVLMVRAPIAAGADLAVAQSSGAITSVTVAEGLVPADAVPVGTSLVGLIARTALTPAMLLTSANAGPSSSFLGRLAITGVSAPCPTDWTAQPASGSVNVFVVTQPVSRGTSAAYAFRSGALTLTSIPAQYAPATAVGTLADLCEQLAAYDLAPNTALVAGVFRRP